MNTAHRLIPPQSTRRLRDGDPLARVRSQAAFVRALLDEVERVSSPGSQDVPAVQLVEELTRLGRQFLEVAEAARASLPSSMCELDEHDQGDSASVSSASVIR